MDQCNFFLRYVVASTDRLSCHISVLPHHGHRLGIKWNATTDEDQSSCGFDSLCCSNKYDIEKKETAESDKKSKKNRVSGYITHSTVQSHLGHQQ